MTNYKLVVVLSFMFISFSFCHGSTEVSNWDNFTASVYNNLVSIENGVGSLVGYYYTILTSADCIYRNADSLSDPDKSRIQNDANLIQEHANICQGRANQLYTQVHSLTETFSSLQNPSDGDISSVTNKLAYISEQLSSIYYELYSANADVELVNIRQYLYSLKEFIINDWQYSFDDVESRLSSINNGISTINSNLGIINSKFDSLATDVFGIRYTVNRLYSSFTSFLDSWLTHADHQDNFYYNTTNYLNEILFNLINSTNNDFNLNYDFTNILYSIYLDLASNTNILNRWKSQISRGNDLRVDNWEYYQPKTKTDGSYNGSMRNKTLGDAIMSRIYESLWSSSPSLPYDPLLELTLLNYYSDQALTASVNWQSLIHANTIRLKDEIPDTLHNIATSLTNLHFQSLTATVPGLEILTNNTPIASLNHASWDWHMFFTNFYMYVSLGPENYNITNVGVSSTWHDNTNWFNRIEALLAALVFKDDNSGRVNTNVVSTSATESAVSDVTTALRSVVEIDNSFSQNVSSSANTIIDMLTEWTQQITSSAQLKGSFDMFNIPHLPVDDSQVHPDDSPASGDWAFRISVDDTDFGGFVHFLRSLTTVLWLCVFMFFALKMSLFLLICICKFVYFCYVVFSAMMGGD